MAKNRNLYITDLGKKLWTEVELSKGKIEFTKIVLGSGIKYADYTPAQIEKLTAMEIPKLELTELEISKDAQTEGVVNIRALLNTEVVIKESFRESELGIFAREKKDEGSYGEVILYAYRNLGAEADVIPTRAEGESWELVYNILTVVSNCEVVQPSIVITGDITGKRVAKDGINYVAVNYTRDNKKIDWIPIDEFPTGDLEAHIVSYSPHPNLLNTGNETSKIKYVNLNYASDNKKLDWMEFGSFKEEIVSNKTLLSRFKDKIAIKNLAGDVYEKLFDNTEEFVSANTESNYKRYLKKDAFGTFDKISASGSSYRNPRRPKAGIFKYQLTVLKAYGTIFKEFFVNNQIIVGSEISLVQIKEPSGSKIYPAKVLGIDVSSSGAYALYVSIPKDLGITQAVSASSFAIYASTVNFIDKLGIVPFDSRTYDVQLKVSGNDWTNILPQKGKTETIDHILGSNSALHLEGECFQSGDLFVVQPYFKDQYVNVWQFDNNLKTATNTGMELKPLGNMTYIRALSQYPKSLGNNGIAIGESSPAYLSKDLTLTDVNWLSNRVIKQEPFTLQFQLQTDNSSSLKNTLYNEYVYVKKTYVPTPATPNVWAWWNFDEEDETEALTSKHSVDGASDIKLFPSQLPFLNSNDTANEAGYLLPSFLTITQRVDFGQCIGGVWELDKCPFPEGDFTFEFIKSPASVHYGAQNAFYSELEVFKKDNQTMVLLVLQFVCSRDGGFDFTVAQKPNQELVAGEVLTKEYTHDEYQTGDLGDPEVKQGQFLHTLTKGADGYYTKHHSYFSPNHSNWTECLKGLSYEKTARIPAGWTFMGRRYYFSLLANDLFLDEIRVMKGHLDLKDALPYVKPWVYQRKVEETLEFKAPAFQVAFDGGYLKLETATGVVGEGDYRTLITEKRSVPLGDLPAKFNTWQLTFDGTEFKLFINEVAKNFIETVETNYYPIPEAEGTTGYVATNNLVFFGDYLNNQDKPTGVVNKMSGSKSIEFISALSVETDYKQRLTNVPLSNYATAIIKANTINQGLKLSSLGQEPSIEQSFKLADDIQGDSGCVFLLSEESDGSSYPAKLYKIDKSVSGEISFIDAGISYPTDETTSKFQAILSADQCYSSGHTTTQGLDIQSYAGKSLKTGTIPKRNYLLPIFAVRLATDPESLIQSAFRNFHFVETRKTTDYNFKSTKLINFDEPCAVRFISFSYEMLSCKLNSLTITGTTSAGKTAVLKYNTLITDTTKYKSVKFDLDLTFANDNGYFRVKNINVLTDALSSLTESEMQFKPVINNGNTLKELQTFITYKNNSQSYPFEIDLFKAYAKYYNLRFIKESFTVASGVKEFTLSYPANVFSFWYDRGRLHDNTKFNFRVWLTDSTGAFQKSYLLGSECGVAFDTATNKSKITLNSAPTAGNVLHISYWSNFNNSDWIELATGKSLTNPHNSDYRLIGFKGAIPEEVLKYSDNLLLDVKYQFLINQWRKYSEISKESSDGKSTVFWQVPTTYNLDPTSIKVVVGTVAVKTTYNATNHLIIFSLKDTQGYYTVSFNYKLNITIPALVHTGIVVE